MDVNTGHLVSGEEIERWPEAKRAAYRPVPPELHGAARRVLAGNTEGQVSLTSGGKLSQWAAGERAKAKTKRKTAKAARKRNRA